MCDTFVAVSKATEDGSVIFGKNSDREPNEAQCLEYYPPEKFSKNHQLDCTYLSIPQVSETYGVLLCRPFWAALKIKDVYSISNGLTIGEEFDKNHPNLIDNARQKGWLKKGQTFNFSKCYSDWLFTTFSASRFRRNSSYDFLKTQMGKVDVPLAFKILRSHKENEYKPGSHFLMD